MIKNEHANFTVENTDDITKATNIPLIGVVGLKNTKTNLTVFDPIIYHYNIRGKLSIIRAIKIYY